MPSPIKGRCHCGSVRFEAVLTDGLREPRRCNCSLCRMRGAVVVTALYEDVKVVAGEEFLTLYQFNTMRAEHHFCRICGIYPFHRRRSNPGQMAINVACLDGFGPFDFSHVPVYEGTVHPNDRAKPGYAIAGELTYRAAPASDK